MNLNDFSIQKAVFARKKIGNSKTEEILGALYENPYITNAQIGETVGMTERNAANYILRLKKAGRISATVHRWIGMNNNYCCRRTVRITDLEYLEAKQKAGSNKYNEFYGGYAIS